MCFLQFIETNQGVRDLIKTDYLDVARVYRLSFWDRYFHVIFRGTLNHTLTGLKLGLGYGLVMVVAGEFAFSQKGLGFFMWNAWDQFRVIDLYCGLFIFAIMGIFIFYLVDKIRDNLPSV